MLSSILALAAAAGAQPAHAKTTPVDAAQARAEGYAQAKRALAGDGGFTPSSLAASLAAGQSAAPAHRPVAAPASIGALGAPSSSSDFDGLQVQPIADGGAHVRYYKGMATIDREDGAAAVQLTPIGLDHGRLAFAVSVLNLSDASDNFGIENVSASAGDQPVAVLSRDRLQHMASNRAHWKQFGMAMLGGLAAASEANRTDVYHATTHTPYGTYSTSISMPSISGQIAAADTSAATGYAIAGIQARLDATREALADEVLQTTTVDPQDSYAARFVIDKLKGKLPQQVHLVMSFAGQQYPFDFLVSKGR